jgi:hypothetical protein
MFFDTYRDLPHTIKLLRMSGNMTATVIRLSDWMATVIRVETRNDLKLFKLTEELGQNVYWPGISVREKKEA